MADVLETASGGQTFTLKVKATPYSAVFEPASLALTEFILQSTGQPVGLRMAAAAQA